MFLTELGVLLGGDRNVTRRSMLNVIELEQRIADVRTDTSLSRASLYSAALSSPATVAGCV